MSSLLTGFWNEINWPLLIFRLNVFHCLLSWLFPLLSWHQCHLIINRIVNSGIDDYCRGVSRLAPVLESQEEHVSSLGACPVRTEEGEEPRFFPPWEVKDDGWGRGLWCEFFPGSKAVLFGFSYIQTAATGWQRRERSCSKRFWDAAKGWKMRRERPATVSALPAFQGVLPLRCVAFVFPQSSLEPQDALGDWCDVELSCWKECAHPRVTVLLPVPPLGRDCSLCMWLDTGQIPFLEITKTRKGNPFPCEYQLHGGGPRY